MHKLIISLLFFAAHFSFANDWILKTYHLQDLFIQMPALDSKEIQKRFAAGGDDVGNGGGRTQLKMIQLIQEMERDLQKVSIQGIKGANLFREYKRSKIVFVKKIEENGLQYAGFLTGQGLLLNKALLNTSDQSGEDLRNLIIEMALVLKGYSTQHSSSTAAKFYSELSAKAGRVPFCHESLTLPLASHKTPVTETLRAAMSQKELGKRALSRCQENGLQFCRIKKAESFGANASVTYIGFKVRLSNKSQIALKKDRCFAARACENFYTSSPYGQIPPQGFSNLNQHIKRICH